MMLASPYRACEIPLLGFENGATHVRTYGVEVLVNGSPVKLVLDTGAAGIVMSRAAAERAGLMRFSDATVRGIGDNAKVTGRLSRDRGAFSDRRRGVSRCGDQCCRAERGWDRRRADRIEHVFRVSDHAGFRGRKAALDPLPELSHADEELQDRVESPQMRDAARVFRFGHILLVPARVNSHDGRCSCWIRERRAR